MQRNTVLLATPPNTEEFVSGSVSNYAFEQKYAMRVCGVLSLCRPDAPTTATFNGRGCPVLELHYGCYFAHALFPGPDLG